MSTDRPELITHYDLEKAVFSAAEGALRIVQINENYDITGLSALKAVMANRAPRIYVEKGLKKDPRVVEYLTRLGAFVELASSLPLPVDQQG